jgi:hypothetical protein
VASCTAEAVSKAEPRIVRIVFRIVNLPIERVLRFARQRLVFHITIPQADYYDAGHHETASKFVGQKMFRLNIQQSVAERLYGLPLADPVQWAERRMFRERS